MKKRIFLLIYFLLLLPSIVFAYNFSLSFSLAKTEQIKWEDLLPSLSWSPSSYAFGNVSTASNRSFLATITNNGNDLAEDITLSVSGAGFRIYSGSFPGTFGNISSGKSKTKKVMFSPVSTIEYTGFINYSAPNIAKTSLALTGTGFSNNLLVSVNTVEGTTYGFPSTYNLAQTFTVAAGEGGVLKSVTLLLAAGSNPATITARIGAAGSTDLSTIYTEGTTSITSSAGEITIPIPNGPTLVEGNVYMVAFGVSTGTTQIRYKNSGSSYAGGMFWSYTTKNWILTGHSDSTRDLYLKYTVGQ